MKELIEKLAGKKLFFISLGVVGYFCFLILDWYVLHIDCCKGFFIILGIFGEILIFPSMFLVQPALLVLSIIHCTHEKFRIKSWAFWSFLILLVSNSFCLGSFIFGFG